MSRKSASRAVGSLVAKGVLTIVRAAAFPASDIVPVFPPAAFQEMNPVAAQWLEDGIGTDVGRADTGVPIW